MPLPGSVVHLYAQICRDSVGCGAAADNVLAILAEKQAHRAQIVILALGRPDHDVDRTALAQTRDNNGRIIMHGVHVQGLDGRKDAGRHALRGNVRRIVAQDKILNILLRPAGVRRHAASGLRHPVAEEHEHISHVKMQVALVQLLFLNKVDGIVIFCDRTVMHKYGVRVIILDQAHAGARPSAGL